MGSRHDRHPLDRRDDAGHRGPGGAGTQRGFATACRLRCARAAQANRGDSQAGALFDAHESDLGYALLLKRYVGDPDAGDAARSTRRPEIHVPDIGPLFFGLPHHGRARLLLHCVLRAAVLAHRSAIAERRRWLLRVALWSLPLPWIAAELGWVVAEYGRQPWAIDGVLPTFLAVSSVPAAVLFTLAGFVLFYSSLAVVEIISDGANTSAADRTRRSASVAPTLAPHATPPMRSHAMIRTTKRSG